MKTLKYILFCAFFCGSLNAFSQQYLEMIDDGSYAIEEIIQSANQYFEGKDKGRGSGYVQFKRWEYMAKRLQDAQGYLVPTQVQINRINAYNQFLNQNFNENRSQEGNWQELGPQDWSATTSWNPGVGRLTGIAIDKTNSNHIIVGANTGGVWKTLDGGATWQPLHDDFPNMYVYAVAIDPSNSNHYYFGSRSGIVYKSTDAGATWSQIADVSNSLINKIVIHPNNSDIIFLCSQNAGVYRTTNGGSSWSSVISDSNGYDVEFKPGDPQIVYAAGSGVHKSTDGGASFNQVSGFDGGAKMIGVSPDAPNTVYVLDANSSIFGGFYVSTDSGDNFTELNHSGKNYFGYSTTGNDNSGQAPRDMDVAVNPNNANEVHIAGVLTWRSLDGGVTFTCTSDWIPGNAASAGIGYCHADVDILLFDGNTLYAGTDGGIFKATDTQNLTANYYEDLTQGIGARQFYKIGISQTTDVVVSGGSQDNGTSFYTAANSWKDWLGADGMETFIDKDDPQIMYGTSQFGSLYRTDNAAASINFLNEPGSGSGNWVTPFEQDPSTPNTIYVGYNEVYKSDNKGASWSLISQNFGSNLDHLKIAPSNNLIMYAASGATFYNTTDGGATNWAVKTAPGGSINSIAIHPSNPNIVAVATTASSKVRISQDGGSTWTTMNTSLPNFNALALVWDTNTDNGLYLGMDYGVYYIDDNFTDWQPFSNGIPNVIVNELEINHADGKLYAGTYGRGLWATPTYEELLAVEGAQAVNTIQAYPNPTQDKLYVTLKQPEIGSLRLFNSQGKLLQVHHEIPLGSRFEMDLSTLARGVYFLRINTAQGVYTQKVLKQ